MVSFVRHADPTEVQTGPEPKLSVVVPCYNEEGSLDELIARLGKACTDVVGEDYEIVLVNDGSSDRTWPIMAVMSDTVPRLICINLARNHGHQLAVTAGLSICRGERILVIDADLQDPPELLGEMMRLMDEGADVVYGQRTKRHGETWFKRVTAAGFYRLLRGLVDVDIPVDTGDFRLMSRRVVNVLNSMPEKHRFIRGMVSWVGFRQVPLLYERQERFAGASHYPLGKMLRFALDAITGFSVAPLRLASYLGILFGLFALVALAYTLAAWVSGAVVPGWTSVMTVVLVIGSTQLVMFGVMGEYLGRLYLEVKQRPLFVIEGIRRSTATEFGEGMVRSIAEPSSPSELPEMVPVRSTSPSGDGRINAAPSLPQQT